MGCIYAVPQDKVAIIERFGRFERIAKPGCLCLPVPCVCGVAGHLSTRLQPIHVRVETKTKDNVFVRVVVAVHLEILPEDEARYDAFYKLANPAHQIQSYVEDVVRGSVPTIELDSVFLQKKEIADHIFAALEKEMQSYGYKIRASLIIDIDPAHDVKVSMNSINAQQRYRVAQGERAEASKYFEIKKAEAEAEATFLQGEGLARQRKAIVEGARDSVLKFEDDAAQQMSTKEVMNLLLVTQYFDTMKEMAHGKSSNVVFLPKRKRGGPGQMETAAELLKAIDATAEKKPSV